MAKCPNTGKAWHFVVVGDGQRVSAHNAASWPEAWCEQCGFPVKIAWRGQYHQRRRTVVHPRDMYLLDDKPQTLHDFLLGECERWLTTGGSLGGVHYQSGEIKKWIPAVRRQVDLLLWTGADCTGDRAVFELCLTSRKDAGFAADMERLGIPAYELRISKKALEQQWNWHVLDFPDWSKEEALWVAFLTVEDGVERLESAKMESAKMAKRLAAESEWIDPPFSWRPVEV